MQVTCSNCSARYRVPDDSIGLAGRRVKCAKCDHIWHVQPETAPEEELQDSPVEPDEGVAENQGTETAVSDSSLDNDVETAPTGQEQAEDLLKSGEDSDNDQQEAQPEAEGEEAAPAAAKDQEEAAERRRKMREQRKRGQSERPAKSKAGTTIGWAALVVFLFGLGGSLYFFRHEIARSWPPATILYQMIGLDYGMADEGAPSGTNPAPDYDSVAKISNTAETRTEADGTVNLIVTGEVENISNQAIPAPQLTALLRNAAGGEIFRWSFEMQLESIPPFTSVSFETLAEDISLDTVTVEVIPEWPKPE